MKNDFKIDFVGIGGIKCATTWIYECLQEHPGLCLAPKDQQKFALFFGKVDKKYYSFFKKNCLKGDFHVSYLESEEAMNRMKEHDPKIIVCLRDPVKRAFSHYNYVKFSRDKEWESFEQALLEEPSILEPGFYFKHLKKYLDNFDDTLILIYEDIEKDPKGFIRLIYKFLEVDDNFIPPSLDLKVNLTSFKLTRLGRFIHKRIAAPLLKNFKWAWKLKQSVFIKKLLCKISEEHGEAKEELRSETHDRLKEVYASDIRSLEQLVGRSLWN